MPKYSLIVCAGVLTLWLGSCASEEETSDTTSPSPSVAAKSPTATQPFAKPLVSEKNAGKKGQTASRVPGLLQSTDPEERARQVQAGINVKKSQTDPFASLPPLVTFRTPAGTSGNLPGFSTGRAGERTASAPQTPNFPQPSRSRSESPQTGSRQRAVPNFPNSRSVASRTPASNTPAFGTPPTNLSPAPAIAALPPLPEPTLAKAVEVSGVVVVGGIAEAIVKAPNEATSRYVRAGQRLSNGQILVKRIEVNSGSDPVVILEQNGVEVARGVGEKSVPTGSPTAIVPSAKRSVFS